MTGHPEGTLADGSAAVAVFSPSAVSVHLAPPGGSLRNVLPAVVTHVEVHGDRVRVRTDVADAEITPAAVADLDLVPGVRIWLAVKATEVHLHPA